MEHPEQYYVVPKSLDQGSILMGFPRVEILPALCVVGLGFMIDYRMLGLSAGFVIFFLVKYLRRKYGENVFSRVMYSYFSTYRNKNFFKRLPSASIKYWRY
ncbi:type IV conjugative transfer system protein TraL [Vibrio furnissii]|uniref:type IV conjugative transfer system protein TraL n=1 Tax=Vibrio furnissii TaxID=29494 RepID=UPI001C9D4BCE|nr:type IV conjugative transfer system protein TraL [Vibrio furnissii]MBY7933085.1 type IV conjugative transfer system protein TraL [Vibrio fluvialis]MCG6230257.1 type IV conjugative transfer system protein TraL [Vibrio furnissii]MCG6268456.1 type IV conjugative transfer system protein TraL [Vibrio furnissii]